MTRYSPLTCFIPHARVAARDRILTFFIEPQCSKEVFDMITSNRLYQRKRITIPFTFIPDDLPPVASPTQALPVSPGGLVEKKLFGATMKNSSADGFCFQTEKKLDPGTDIEVKMINFTRLDLGSHHVETCTARVKWCHQSLDGETQECYDVGVQKKQPESLPVMNMKDPHFASVKCT